jgi:serine/threonine protein kinase
LRHAIAATLLAAYYGKHFSRACMSSERLRQIEELYHSAREEGTAVLLDADPELRREVEKLLAQDSDGGAKLLDQSAENLLMGMAGSRVEAGSQLGPYRIKALLGEGGMGQVFRATDTRLGRSVAIKVLKDWTGRFEKESRAIAALNHPNICTLHDVGPNYLVMELIEGETLAERLKRGRLSVAQALQWGTQIAHALAAAHAQGIIHRDLKPANVMLTKTGVKVLDFGLARSTADPSQSMEGVVMGTPAYMAPEQFAGAGADSRTDIYAMGLILREMLTGRNPDVWEGVPPQLERTVKRCIETDPDERWQSARDLKWELDSIAAASDAPGPPRSRRAMLLGFMALVFVLAAALVYVYFGKQSTRLPLVLASISLPEKSRPVFVAVSPDGRSIALILVKDGRQQIWLRSLDSLDLTPLPGTDGAINPFWSPDSRFIAFFADAKLRKIARSGGPVQTLCDALAVVGGTWNRNGDILLGALWKVQRVSAAGGTPSDIPGYPDVTEHYPVFLPDGRHYIATRNNLKDPAQRGLFLGSIDGPEARQILPDVSRAEIIDSAVAGRAGAVLFTRSGNLMALPFDMKHLQAMGDPVLVAQGIASINGYPLFAASADGTLAFVSGQQSNWQFVWRDRDGRALGSYPNAGGVAMISPDGKKLAFDYASETYVMELAHGVSTRLTFGPENTNPAWSPDGRTIAYDKVGVGLFRKSASGEGKEELLVPAKNLAVPKSWSPDGKTLVYAQINPGTGADLMAVPVNGDRKPFPVVQTPATEDQGQFSPDGRWLAYTSNESGQAEIYAIPFPPSPGTKWLVSRGGGAQPRWRRDGKELFYISADSQMMAVEVATRPTFQSGTAHPLFQSDIVDTGIRTGPLSWDVAPDGKRFLIVTPNSSEASPVNIVLNWRFEPEK